MLSIILYINNMLKDLIKISEKSRGKLSLQFLQKGSSLDNLEMGESNK